MPFNVEEVIEKLENQIEYLRNAVEALGQYRQGYADGRKEIGAPPAKKKNSKNGWSEEQRAAQSERVKARWKKLRAGEKKVSKLK